MLHLSKQSSSFVLLIFGVFAIVIAVMIISWTIQNNLSYTQAPIEPKSIIAQITEPQLLSTEDWVDYQDPNYPIKLSLPPNWAIAETKTIPGYYVLELEPEPKQQPLQIFVSQTTFAGLAELPFRDFRTPHTTYGVQVDYQIYGLKHDSYYYTFDSSLNPNYRDELYTIVQTAQFK
ncbi:MAG: hypothetical protein R3B41_02065 [Candidatus Doudnabacteria bacterium]